MKTSSVRRTMSGLAVLLPALVLTAATTFGAGVTTSQDQTFSDADWTGIPYWNQGGTAILSASQVSESGPNTFRQVTHDYGVGTVIFLHLSNIATYDPSTQGAIAKVDFSYDLKAIAGFPDCGLATAYSLLLEQGGRYFVFAPYDGYPADLIYGCDITWKGFTHTDAVAAHFVEVTTTEAVWTSHPDFSAGGSVITFGFVTSNTISPGTLPRLTLITGIDNWAVSATQEEVVTWTITSSAGPGGGVSPAGPVTVNSGADQTFTITADPGYHVADVLVDGGSVGPVATYTFVGVTADHTISATFTANSSCPSLKDLRAHVVAYGASGAITKPGLVKSLLAKLDAAQASVDRGDAGAFRGQLSAFINEVQAQSGKGINAKPANILIAEAEAVLRGCLP